MTCTLKGPSGADATDTLVDFHKYCDATFEDGTSARVLYKAGANRFHMNLCIVKDSWVKEVTAEKMEPGAEGASTEEDYTPVVDPERTALRLQKALRAARYEAAKIGTGVSEEAQHIFNVISKTLPCRWDGTTIVVMDEVEIRAPYLEVTCREAHEDQRRGNTTGQQGQYDVRGDAGGDISEGHQRDVLVGRVGKLLGEARKESK